VVMGESASECQSSFLPITEAHAFGRVLADLSSNLITEVIIVDSNSSLGEL